MAEMDVIRCVQNIHIRELIQRIHWVVRMRVYFALASLGAGVALYALDASGQAIPALILCGAGLFLLLANLFYGQQIQRKEAHCVGTSELRYLCLIQVVGDYVALAFVVYALGGVETPVMFMVLPNIVIASLFFTRQQSAWVAVMGMVLVSIAPLMEFMGVLEMQTLFSLAYKLKLMSNPAMLGLYLLVFAGSVLICWHLVSTITESLIHNELELEDSYQSMLLLDEEKTKATLRGTHELKAPLAAIKSYVYTLRDGYAGELPEKAKKIVHRIGMRCERLLENITDIIRLGNLRSYVVTESQFTPVDLVAALRLLVQEYKPIAKARSIKLKLRGDVEESIQVFASDEHLSTLFGNLISNAINYSREGAKVIVEVTQQRDSVRVRVEDQGIGIPQEQLTHIFDEHFRAKNAVAHHEHGSGLGLPIVKATAKLLDARLEVASEMGEGTTFSVKFATHQ